MSEYGLKITANANAESVNFLDMNFNLRTNIYKPFMKPNDVPLYVHRQSNHPAGILKNIPLQEALVKSGYKKMKCFPSYHPLSKIINRNTVKICYRCMPNMKKYISKQQA